MLTQHDKLHIVVVWTIDFLAFFFNVLLIIVIVLRTPKYLRTYSVFLLFNAFIDLLTAVVSALGTVRVVQNHQGSMVFVFLGPCSLINDHLCWLCHALHVNLVQQSTILLLCSFGFRLYVLGNAENYIEQKTVPTKMLQRLNLPKYYSSIFPIFGTTRAIFLNAFIVILSPTVMTLIFLVRRKLVMRIAQAELTTKRHHIFIARALTIQMLLPCGVAVASTLWMWDLLLNQNCEFTERFLMIACSLFSLASPLINLIMLPPYRAILPCSIMRNSVQDITFVSM